MRSVILVVLAVFTSAFAVMRSSGDALAAWDYWMDQGGKTIAKCPGNASGVNVKMANRDGQWLYIEGLAICKDTGANYTYDIQHLKVTLNNARINDVVRDPLNFDWIGLAAYRDDRAQSRVQWLYDQAKPIQGTLPKQGNRILYFGNLQFVVPKAALDQSTRLTFYLTAEGIPFTFGAL